MTTKEKIRFLILRSIGNFLVLFALFGVAATFGPALYYEAAYQTMKIRGVNFTVENQAQATQKNSTASDQTQVRGNLNLVDSLSGPKEKILVPIDTNFNLLIPKIGANARVFSSVDPSSPDRFLPILQKGVAHAAGTFFPGQKGNIYLFAHSTDNFWDVGRYNATFYLLKDLQEGDDVVIFFKDVRHDYRVVRTQVTSASEVSYLTHAQTEKELLILQTCWPPGTTWQRLLVFAEPI